MLSRILITASIAALISVAPAAAQDTTTKKKLPLATQSTSQTGTNTQSEQTGTNMQTGQTGTADTSGQASDNQNTTLKKKKKSSQTGQTETQSGQTTQTGETSTDQNATQMKKKKKNASQTGQTETQSGQKTKTKTSESGTQSGTATAKTKTTQDKTATGSTSKVEITRKETTIIRKRLVSSGVRRISRSHVNFDLSIGIAVPSTIVFAPLPASVVEVVPAYRGYLYFVMDDGTIVIVEPGTMRIAYIISA